MVWGCSSTDDGCFPAPVLAQDKSQGRKELNVLSVLRSGAEGTDPLDLHLADLRHFTVRRFRLALYTLNLEGISYIINELSYSIVIIWIYSIIRELRTIILLLFHKHHISFALKGNLYEIGIYINKAFKKSFPIASFTISPLCANCFLREAGHSRLSC